MSLSIKNLILIGVSAFIVASVHADSYQYVADEAHVSSLVPNAENLHMDMQLAREKNVPVLVEFSSPGCGYCVALEEEILEPMIRSGEYGDRVILRKIEVADYNGVIDFDGKERAVIDLALKHNIDFYPTLVFFDANGNEVGQRLVGLTLLEFYFAELDSALQLATEAM